jgi:hypothetical protein
MGGTYCYDPTLITKPKTFHIQNISAFFEALGITVKAGKIVAILLFPRQGKILYWRSLCYNSFSKTINIQKEKPFCG